MLYSLTKKEILPVLNPVEGLVFSECKDPELISTLGKISYDEAKLRMTSFNRAYVAYLNEFPAAFGWLALGKARIGELNHEFTLPVGNGYLWNFRTLPEFKGLGIYPRLLQFIIQEERSLDRFWIMHAPENIPSERGILKAGFTFTANVSLLHAERVIYSAVESDESETIHQTFGFSATPQEHANCWNCSSPYIKNKTECCCTTKGKECSSSSKIESEVFA